MIARLGETVSLGGRNLTWRQVIRREANQIKKCICEDAPYEGFKWGGGGVNLICCRQDQSILVAF